MVSKFEVYKTEIISSKLIIVVTYSTYRKDTHVLIQEPYIFLYFMSSCLLKPPKIYASQIILRAWET